MSLKVHVVDGGDDYHFEVWLDTEIAAQDGLCIGTGRTVPIAIDDARKALAVAGVVLERAEYETTAIREQLRAAGAIVELGAAKSERS